MPNKLPIVLLSALLLGAFALQGRVGSVTCGDDEAECPDGYTCCKMDSDTWGCCPFGNAVCCSDQLHCCPQNYQCGPSNACNAPNSTLSDPARFTVKKNIVLPSAKLTFAKTYLNESSVYCPDGSACPNGNTCCSAAGGGYGCCPLASALCCADQVHCCPQGSKCNSKDNTCEAPDGTAVQAARKTLAVRRP